MATTAIHYLFQSTGEEKLDKMSKPFINFLLRDKIFIQ